MLTDFAIRQLGWRLDKQKSTKKDIVLGHEQYGKIIVPQKRQAVSGHWVFSWVDKKGGGTLIDLMLLAGYSWKDIKEAAHGPRLSTPAAALSIEQEMKKKEVVEDPQKQQALAMARFAALQPEEGPSYLAHRGIHKEVYENLHQVKVNPTTAIFRLY